ncbi:hypothetical protein EB001_06120 [bacterium]|jgi:hypothetical protein|nr:hypothetical protein [bacterium]
MSNVQFEEDNIGFGQVRSVNQYGALTAWLIKVGIIKDESQSKGVLLFIFFLNIVATGLIIYYFI